MPDALGRYTLTEMEIRVRDEMDAVNLVLDAGGFTVNRTIVNQNVSTEDIDKKINEALVALYTEAILGHEDLFATDVYQDIKQGVVQYAFPQNMLQLHWMRWKNPGLKGPQLVPQPLIVSAARPDDYIPMVEVFDPMDLSMSAGYYGSPTWRRNGSNFVLGSVPTQDNIQGILLNIIALPPQLKPSTSTVPSTSVIEGLFVRLSQEVVIYDATVRLCVTKNKLISPETIKAREEWHQRFFSAVENAQHQPSVNMTTNRLISSNFSGRSSKLKVGW
jgi:hypothetical protein